MRYDWIFLTDGGGGGLDRDKRGETKGGGETEELIRERGEGGVEEER